MTLQEIVALSVPALLDRLENHYQFECPGGPLRNVVEWQALRDRLAVLEAHQTALLNALDAMTAYSQHEPLCKAWLYPGLGTCGCGLVALRKQVQALEPVPPPPSPQEPK